MGMTRWKNKLISYLLITAGTFFMALGINIVYEPMSMVTGGFSGVGIIVKKVMGDYLGIPFPIGLTTLVLNLPLFWIAMRRRGGKFMIKTLYASLVFSLALMLVPIVDAVQHEDYLMAAVLGGTLNGIGLGLVFSQNASTGGSDLLSTLLKPHAAGMSLPELLAVVDGAIVLAGMFFFGIRTGLYAIVAVFITGRVSDALLDGLKFAKMVYIISDFPSEISRGIMDRLHRGVTGLQGSGMYSGAEKKVLICVVAKKEIVELMKIVKDVDNKAFVIVSEAREVQGEGFLDWEKDD